MNREFIVKDESIIRNPYYKRNPNVWNDKGQLLIISQILQMTEVEFEEYINSIIDDEEKKEGLLFERNEYLKFIKEGKIEVVEKCKELKL